VLRRANLVLGAVARLAVPQDDAGTLAAEEPTAELVRLGFSPQQRSWRSL